MISPYTPPTPHYHNSGLLGPTHWYYRHRDEKAQQRILSIPRKKGARLPIPEKQNLENKVKDNSDITEKIQLLKMKIEENRIKSLELDNSEDSKTKINFSKHMAKIN
jgi:hypothetical protein